MIRQIDFTKKESNEYEASFVSTGPVTVQVQRKSPKPVTVLGNIPDMPPCVTGVYANPYNDGIIFGVDLPVGVVVTLRCNAEITLAKLMTND